MQVHDPLSVFDIFKIGIGPSSSHTLGPWRAAQRFVNDLQTAQKLVLVRTVKVLLYGSLAKTGKGHGTDIAVQLGLAGDDPVTFDVEQVTPKITQIATEKRITLNGTHTIEFDPAQCVELRMRESLPHHPNAMTCIATFADGSSVYETFYSIGGGFVVKEGDQNQPNAHLDLPFPITKADDLLHWCIKTGFHVWEIVKENEESWRPWAQTRKGVLDIWNTIRSCVFRGCHTEGYLPGGLNVHRRGHYISTKLLKDKDYDNYDEWIQAIREGGKDFRYILDWVSCFALAVNEENASFGRVVTAPTNGAAGVIPAVLMYYVVFGDGNTDDKIVQFLLTASEIGCIFKKGATISAAMGGCQAEIGVSAAMAAGALTECLGGTQRQVLMAAEIAMEHHLGLTCDPIGGLVQIPCIERNSMGAIKAITATQLALQSRPELAKVSLDAVVKTMWHTALDMNSKYKETSEGGLAVNIPLGLSEC